MTSKSALGQVASRAMKVLAEPVPLRFQVVRALDMAFNFMPYPAKLNLRSIDRPHFGHCLLHAALLAKRLGHKRISAIEFGVAGGNGLVSLERHARLVEKETGVATEIYGFDTGEGMPPAGDHRDVPYLFQAGYYKMDIEKLKARLTTAKLCIGRVEDTVAGFFEREKPPPIGFMSIDVDYYSSTVPILKLLEAASPNLLPRVVCYLDDMAGDIDWAFNDFTGELLAVHEFNAAHADIKIAPVQGLRFVNNHIPQLWHEQVFVAHLFKHPDYGRNVNDRTELPLRG